MSYCVSPTCPAPETAGSLDRCAACGSLLLLNGRYRAIKLVGSGGFGRTFLALDEAHPFNPRCAVKQMLTQLPQQRPLETMLVRFYDEGKQLAQLGKHPQLPQALAFFEQEQAWYLVQEWVEGRNLSVMLQEDGVFSGPQIRQFLQNLLPVLAFIHDHQLLHRDIKPQNIIYRRAASEASPQPVLVDFGAAKQSTANELAQTGTAIGTAEYAAPEQVRGKAVFASDIYSLGVTCIHLLTGVSPLDLFDHKQGTWVWRDFLKSPLQDIALGKIVDQMIRQDLDSRYPSANAVLQDLQTGSAGFAWRSLTKRWRLLGGIAIATLAISWIGFGGLRWEPDSSTPSPVSGSLEPSPPLSTERLLATRACSYCDLSNVNLSGMNLNGVDLTGANLTGANLSNADLSGTNFSGAVLEDVNLSSSNLVGTNFSGCNLTNANFSNANLRDAQLFSANLEGANFNHADLTGVRGK
jgi:serine/threonine protein kinase